MADLNRVPHIPFPIEASGDGAAPGQLWAFPCACGALEDLTLLFLRDASGIVPTGEPEALVACIQTDLTVDQRFAPVENVLKLWKYEPGLVVTFLTALARALDAVPGMAVRLFSLLRHYGWLPGSFCTLFHRDDASSLIPWLRKMDILCVQEENEDGSISLERIPLRWDELPLGELWNYFFWGSARMKARMYLYEDGEADLQLD